jgi:hypothetical protein
MDDRTLLTHSRDDAYPCRGSVRRAAQTSMADEARKTVARQTRILQTIMSTPRWRKPGFERSEMGMTGRNGCPVRQRLPKRSTRDLSLLGTVGTYSKGTLGHTWEVGAGVWRWVFGTQQLPSAGASLIMDLHSRRDMVEELADYQAMGGIPCETMGTIS